MVYKIYTKEIPKNIQHFNKINRTFGQEGADDETTPHFHAIRFGPTAVSAQPAKSKFLAEKPDTLR